ncbi:ADP-ribose pyrophosphatase [Catenovulum agarivorans DS-2]|uniref:ADP-ribose pyrophosphatase n=1 Tax=Catenovulum agarivorans DS-2 TaxID=1328313 RepID=W7QK16_9ALTE|nr:ADP-ribose diphosphatase [Catenovulum agarivorans]EWH12246.1 ADP-ribose pyrophosphatase [Catenovulum agarivorans DS-2]
MKKLLDDFPYSLNKQDVEVVAKKSLFSRFFNVSLVSFKHKLFAGGWSDTVEREIFERGDAVVVLPYDPILDQIVMVEQIRVGCMENAPHPWAFELVGGMVEPGQSIESVALRETEEETGLHATDLIPMQSYLSSCGGTSERIFLYVAKVDSTQCGDICGLDYEHEDIKVHQFSTEQVFHWLDKGIIDAAAVVIALQWFKLHKQNVLDKWASKG